MPILDKNGNPASVIHWPKEAKVCVDLASIRGLTNNSIPMSETDIINHFRETGLLYFQTGEGLAMPFRI